MYRVLLISFVNWDSLVEIPTLLKDGGCTVDVYAVKDSWVLQNNAHQNWIECSTDPNEFIAALINFLHEKRGVYDWIIPGDDIVIRLLNERLTDEAFFYKVMPLTKIENRELLGSKAGFSNLCKKYGIKTPRYLIYDESLTTEYIGQYMQYPFLMKLDKSEGGYGVFLCNNETELKELLGKIENKTNMVFQQFISGYDVNTEVMYKNEELMVYSYSRTTKIMGKFGVSTQRDYYQNPEIAEELKKIGKSFGLNGFGNVVFMYSVPEQTHYLIEVDMRPNAWMYYGKFMGNDFAEAVRNAIAGKLSLIVPKPEFADKKMRISLYKKDLYRCILEKDFKELGKWILNTDGRWKFVPFHDSKTFSSCTKFLVITFTSFLSQKIKRSLGAKKQKTA
jgi:predicted ATP-grasp superfamily ATP-dependent carboligase